MKSIKNYTAHSLSFILLLIVVTSCIKKNGAKDCKQNSQIEGPISVTEGEDFTLIPHVESNAIDPNTSYFWGYPDMSSYNNTTDGMVEVYDSSPETIENADIRDDGEYSLKIISTSSECPEEIATHTVNVIPKTSPCFDQLSTEYLIIEESFSSNTITQTYDPVLTVPWSEDEFEVELTMPLFTYQLKFEFDIPIPDYSSTYKLRNLYSSFNDDEISEDPIIQASVLFIPDNETYDSYQIDDNQEDLYLKRENGKMYLSFCNLTFRHRTIQGRTITISGKVEIEP